MGPRDATVEELFSTAPCPGVISDSSQIFGVDCQ
jgi:hypothetical protein